MAAEKDFLPELKYFSLSCLSMAALSSLRLILEEMRCETCWIWGSSLPLGVEWHFCLSRSSVAYIIQFSSALTLSAGFFCVELIFVFTLPVLLMDRRAVEEAAE